MHPSLSGKIYLYTDGLSYIKINNYSKALRCTFFVGMKKTRVAQIYAT